MLFVNFICVLFLMVLISGHTISKSIANEDDIDDIFDSLNDVDFKREHKGKFDRLFHHYRREKSHDVTKTIKTVKPTVVVAKKTKPKESPTETIDTKLINTSENSKGYSFWRKFITKGKKDNNDEELSRKIRERERRRRRLNRYSTIHFHKQVTTTNEGKYYDSNEGFIKTDRKIISKKRRKNNQFDLEKRKREVIDNEFIKDLRTNHPKNHSSNKAEIRITPHKEYYKSTTKHNLKTATIKTYEPLVSDDNLTSSLASLTTKINRLKFLYGLNRYQTSAAIIKENYKSDFIESSTESLEYPSTAQIEALLNDIKVKAVQMVSEQNPSITDIITNTVTETTYEVDPILEHFKINSPGYTLNTFVSLNANNKLCDKMTGDSTGMLINIAPNESIVSSTKTHDIEARSITEDAYAIAQCIEAKLQDEMKHAFKTVKNKLCGKEYRTQTLATKKTATKTSQLNTVAKTKTTISVTSNETNTNNATLLRVNRGKANEKHMKKKTEVKTPTASSNDDYDMLTVYEQMLAKSHENNDMKILIPTETLVRKKKETLKLSKRNTETLTDLSLKENIQKIYNDDEEMPEETIDYQGDENVKSTEMSTLPDEVRNQSFEEGEQDQVTPEDVSFEGLSNKLAYNDYVNGYKHYLKFQREQGEQNFSDLIKYQAHRHHNVDDIGKFILSKLPEIPTRRYKRNFFDKTDTMDDRAVSRSSDDSWFKKHFYLFIENGPPKKYHTSQNVSLKSPVTETSNKTATYYTDSVLDNPVLAKKCATTESPNDWSEQSKDYMHVPSYRTTTMNNIQPPNSSSLTLRGLNPQKFMYKFFGGKEKETSKTLKNEKENEKKANQKNEIDDLLDEELERYKRNAKKHDTKIQYIRSSNTYEIDDFSKKTDVKSKKYGYVDVNLINTTAVIKEDKKPKSKIKNFLSKFRLRKNKKSKPKKTKRSSLVRVQRFHPFYGLRHMFKTKNKNTNADTSKPLPDFNVMTSHIPHIKPIKYINPLKVENIKNMIPNITYDIPYGTSVNNIVPTVNYNTSYGNMIPGDSDVLEAPKLTRPSHLKLKDSKIKSNVNLLKFGPKLSARLNNVTPNDTFKHNDKFKNLKQPQSLNRDIIYSATPNELNNDVFEDTTLHDITSESIHNDIDELQMKLSMRHKPSVNTVISNIFNKKITSPYFVNTQMKVKPQLNNISNTIAVKIRAKEFYIVASKGRHEKSIYNTSKMKSLKHYNDHETTVKPNDKSNLKPLPDYFNDLLMWHGDILNVDRIHNPTWGDILKSINIDTDSTTPGLTNIQKELLLLNFLNKTKASTIYPIISYMSRKTEKTINPDIFREDFRADIPVNKKPKRFMRTEDEQHYFKETDGTKDDVQNTPSVIVDSTIFPFINDINLAIDTSRPKKMPKSYIKNAKHDILSVSSLAVAKTNKQPLQYYTTPLPMSVNDFNNFLKENNIDVESVTSPLIELPNLVDIMPNEERIALKKNNKHKMDNLITNLLGTAKSIDVTNSKIAQDQDIKINPTTHYGKKLKTTNTIDLFKNNADLDPDPENQIEYLDHLSYALDDDYNFEIDNEKISRHKRYKPFDEYNRYRIRSLQREANRRKCDSIQNPMNFFAKTTSQSNIDQMNLHLINPSMDKLHPKMEITIIDLDEDKETQNTVNTESDYHTVFSDEETPRRDTDMTTNYNINEDTKTITTETINDNILQKTQSTVAYENVLNELNRIFAVTNPITNSKSLFRLDKKIDENDDPNATKTEHETSTKYEIIKTLPVMQPHRVQISGHSYKYDVYYNDHHNLKSTKMEGDILSTLFRHIITNSPADNSTQRNTINSEDAQSEFEVRNKRKNSVKLRRSRGASTPREIKSNVIEISTFCDSENLIQNNMKVSKEEMPKRKLNLLLRIQNKLNLLTKFANTTILGKMDTTKPMSNATNMITTTVNSQSGNPISVSSKTDDATELKQIAVDTSLRKGTTEMVSTKTDQKLKIFTPTILNALENKMVPESIENEGNYIISNVGDFKFHLSTISNEGHTLNQADSTNKLDTVKSLSASPKNGKTNAAHKRIAVDTSLSDEVTVQYDDIDTNSTELVSTETGQQLKIFTPVLNAFGIKVLPDSNKSEGIYIKNSNVGDFKFHVSTTSNKDQTFNQAGATNNLGTDMRYQLVPKPDENEAIYVETGLFDDKFQVSTTTGESQCLKKEDSTNNLNIAIRKQLLPKPDENEAIYVEEGAFDNKEVTQNHITENVKQKTKTTRKVQTKGLKPNEKETVVIKPGAHNDSINQKHDAKESQLTKLNKDKIKSHENKPISNIKLDKRDITLPAMNYYTAKDVAALEVIVDLAKNTLGFDERTEPNLINRVDQPLRHPNKVDSVTNSIQVHIAIPSDYQSNKRSADPIRIRKVFSAKLSSPVDLEYQVHSFEHFDTVTATHNRGLSPGMYLIVSNDSSVLKGQLALKPVGSSIDLNRIIAKRATNATEKHEIETTSVANLGKVTLSRDFISAVNKHLVQLYDNFSKLDASTHKFKVKRAANESHNAFSLNAIKKFFGHDRVCDCKCRPNKTMCRGCAASDAVITELIFEFENLAQYMSDHCTEIQTFFWMNPSGGKELKDAVHKIDGSLKDYYKSVKNKCKGRPCETFVTYIDKRNFNKAINKDNNYIGWPMAKDLNTVADLLKNTTKLNICYDQSIKTKADTLIDAFNRCISYKRLNKRANNDYYKTQKAIKNVYSLDNVNVNIICNSESNTDFVAEYAKNGNKSRMFDYVVDEYNDDKLFKFKKLFGGKKKKYYTLVITDKSTKMTTSKLFGKREAKLNQVELPLIADTGGTFWNDYIKNTVEPRNVRETKILNKDTKINKPDLQSEFTNINMNPILTTKDKLSETTISVIETPISSTETPISTTETSQHVMLKIDNTSTTEYSTGVDYLSNNINELLKLLGNYADVEDLKEMYTEDVPTSPPVISKHRHKIKKAKTKKTTKISVHEKKLKATNEDSGTGSDRTITNKIIDKQKSKDSTNKVSFSSKNSESYSANGTHSKTPVTESANNVNTKTMVNTTTTKAVQFEAEVSQFLGKIQKTTLDYIKKIMNKKLFKSDTTKTMKENRRLRSSSTSSNMYSNKTTAKSQTIVILNDYDDINDKHIAVDSYMNAHMLKELLLSVIQHETSKLNDEWLKVDGNMMVEEHTDADMETIKQNYFFGMTNSGSNTHAKKPSTGKDKANTKPCKTTKPTSKSNAKTINPKSKTNKSKANQKGFLNRLFNKFSSIVTPGTNVNQKAVTKTHPARIIEENESTTDENSGTDSSVDYTISGLKIKPTQGTKITTEAEVSPGDIKNQLTKETNKEVCDTHCKSKKVCDIRATYDYVLNLYRKLGHRHFENYVKNVTCFKYNEAPEFFIINPKRKEDDSVSKYKRWDWIRKKRSSKDIHNIELNYAEFYDRNRYTDKGNKYINQDSTVDISRTKENTIEYEEFDKYDRVKYGIYRLRKKRRKRTVDAKRLDLGLKNLQPLKPALNEIYSMPGDSITMDCLTSEDSSDFATNYNSYSNIDHIFWIGDTKDILEQDNIVVDGLKVTIENVQPKNVGHYICRKGDRVQKSVRLSVISLPSFILILSPTYSSNANCSYDDLNALQYLAADISRVACCDEHCKVRIEEPVCIKDKGTGQAKMNAAIVIKVDPHPEVDCSVQCRRDLHLSLAKLHAYNAPIFNDIKVSILYERGNKTFTPSKAVGKPLITHRLRRKDTKRRRDYQKLMSKITSGDVSIVESCPAGYYLVPEQKICATCPQNTTSLEGDNTCSVCPHGTRSGAGADRCHLVMSRLRRYDWWWYPPCGYCVACGGVVCACGACVALALLVHMTSRGWTCVPPASGREKQGRRACGAARAAPPRARPLSPSRVILARFFKPSLSSARATDSQEIKFEQWKERNIPPPLPPIDFD